MKALVGTKLGMTSVIGEDGSVNAVTVVQAGPMSVTQIRTEEKDGYSAVQLGYLPTKLGKAQAGHQKAAKVELKHLKEFQADGAEINVGQQFDVGVFSEGELVKVTGTAKGKGFAGTIKRHNFHRGPKTHGSSNYRKPGSIGSMYPQKIFKGKRMAGRMGGHKVSVRNLKVAFVDPQQHLIGLVGAVPGPRKSVLSIEGLES